MGASSVTGTGNGDAGTYTSKELAVLAHGPSIVAADIVTSDAGGVESPPSPGAVVTFPNPLPGTHEDYCIMLTTLNAGYAYVIDTEDDATGFTGFGITTESDGDVMYMVVKRGFKPSVR